MAENGENILVLKNIVKTFNGNYALRDMNLKVKKGTVHALLRENGAGKSTLIKTLSGAHKPDSGTIEYEGVEYTEFDPKKSLDLGIGVVYQEFNMIPYLTVADNVFIGCEPTSGIRLNKKSAVQKTKEIFDVLGIKIDPNEQVGNLSIAYQQMVEIAKIASKNVKLLVLDEPTAALSDEEVNALFKLVATLKSQGVSIIYISHRMEELEQIADEVTIIRDGEYVDTVQMKSTTKDELIAKMVGRPLGKNYPEGNYTQEEVVLKVSNLNNDRVKNVSFELHKGEILGFGGLVGAGRTETMRAIFGADYSTGEIEIKGKKVSISSPRVAVENGIVYLTENRKSEGLVMKMSIGENITLSNLDLTLNKFKIISSRKEKAITEKAAEGLRLKYADMKQLVSGLSGGNQQKVVMAKWLLTESSVLIFDEPTRGIDVGVKQEIYQIMKKLAKQGKAIIMISSELPELIGVSDRILVMNRGSIVGEADPSTCKQEDVLALALKEV